MAIGPSDAPWSPSRKPSPMSDYSSSPTPRQLIVCSNVTSEVRANSASVNPGIGPPHGPANLPAKRVDVGPEGGIFEPPWDYKTANDRRSCV